MQADIQDSLVDLLVRRSDTAVTGAGMVDWATSALAAGVESPSLVILAGLPQGSSLFETEPYLHKAMAELGIVAPDPAELRRAYVGMVSRRVLRGHLSCDDALALIHQHAVSPLGHPPDLMPWCYVEDRLGPNGDRRLTEPQVAQEARALASVWSRRPAFGISSPGGA